MKLLVLAAALALPVAVSAAEAPDIKVADQGGGNYRLTLTSTTIQDPDRGQDAMLLTGMQVCGDKLPHFGHYKFQSQQKIGKDGTVTPGQPFVMDQDISCGTAVPHTTGGTNPEGNWTPSQAETDKMMAVTQKFFAAKDSGDYQATYALLDAGMKDLISSEVWKGQIQDFNRKSGALVGRKLAKFTWSKDPAGAPALGIYAVVDYVSHYQAMDVECGYLAWFEQPDGSFLLAHEQTGFLSKEQEEKMSPQEVVAIKAQLGCLAD